LGLMYTPCRYARVLVSDRRSLAGTSLAAETGAT